VEPARSGRTPRPGRSDDLDAKRRRNKLRGVYLPLGSVNRNSGYGVANARIISTRILTAEALRVRIRGSLCQAAGNTVRLRFHVEFRCQFDQVGEMQF
jgi:hypothetical protein